MAAQQSSGRALNLAKNWAAVCRHRSLRLLRLATQVRNSADLRRIEQLKTEMKAEAERDPTGAAKYADYRLWIPFNVARIGSLGFQDARPSRILDIGCGPGYFLSSARICAHEAYGIDAPSDILSDVENRVYSELLAALGMTPYVSSFLIERYVPLSSPLRDLDIITAFWICFNRHRQQDEWSADEWRFFVDDALSHLRPGGILHLELNPNPERYGILEWYDRPTLDFFRSGGTVERNVVRIQKAQAPAQ
jgi:SAM-dependent methyltransferase